MRIAFVGKGGSGKTTLTALFTKYIEQTTDKNVWLVDADLNIHTGNLMGYPEIDPSKQLSSPQAQETIKNFIKGNNSRIVSTSHIKKTTPPTAESGLIIHSDSDNLIYQNFSSETGKVFHSIVGTYQDDAIGTSCYHNNLSILENILSHSIDQNEYIVVDMVAGIDAFAGTLHAQFDLLILAIEPTIKSITVFNQYLHLANKSGVSDYLYVVGNKIRSKQDKSFILNNIPSKRVIGFIGDSNHLREIDQGVDTLTIEKMDPESLQTLSQIDTILRQKKINPNKRLEMLYSLHIRYVNQAYIKDRFGDLSHQIDPDFDFEQHIKQYELQ